MPAVKQSKEKEETATSLSKRKRFLSKLRPHRSKKPSSTPPTVVNVNESSKNGTSSSKINPTVLFQDEATPKPQQKKNKIKLKSSWISRTKWFTKMSDNAFAVVDADGSGEVDEKELYSGLLLIHLKLGCYAGPAACRPVDRQRVHDVFEKMDVDDSGSLDKEEFREVMMVLCSNIFTRVMVQCTLSVPLCNVWIMTCSLTSTTIGSMTLIIVPLVAQYILDAVYFVNRHFWMFVTDLDEYSPVMDKLELFLEGVRDAIAAKLPRIVIGSWRAFIGLLDKVPESVWNTGMLIGVALFCSSCQRRLTTLICIINVYCSSVDTIVLHSGVSGSAVYYFQG